MWAKAREVLKGIVIVCATHEPRTRWGMRRMERRTRNNATKMPEILAHAMRNWENVLKGK